MKYYFFPYIIFIITISRYCIVDLQLFTQEEFNYNLKNANYGHLKNDKPGEIQREHLDNNLRQSAAQLITLAHSLPFLIYEWTVDCEDEGLQKRIDCFTTVLKILNISMAYEIKEESIGYLKHLIQVFFIQFKDIYPDYLIPKFHFLVHLPTYIRRFGPPRQQWCMRFEGLHAYFKGLVPVVKNVNNIAFTLSYRHQARLCSRLANYPGMPSKKFLYKGDQVKWGELVELENTAHKVLLRTLGSQKKNLRFS